MTLGDLVKKYRENNNISMDEFSRMCNLSKGYISMLENNTNPRNNKPISPTLPTIKKIASAMNVDVDSILKALDPNQEIDLDSKSEKLAGIGSGTEKELVGWDCENAIPQEFRSLIEKYDALDTLGREHVDTVLQWETWRVEQMQNVNTPATKPPLRLIQYYQRLASAGTGQYVFDSIPTEQIEIPDIPEYKKVQFALGINGLSMEPLYSHGDILLIEPTQEIQPGEIGIFLHNGESFVKELGDCVLHSLNDLYDDIEITEDTRCVGRVIDKLDAPISVSEELGEKLRALAKKVAEKHA